jgi:hypothetical protein
MGGLGRIPGALVGIVLLVFSGTAVAGDKDEPDVQPAEATETGSSSALLRAYVDPNDRPTTYYFEYGTTTAYGIQTATASAGSGDDWTLVSARVEGLQPSTTYHVRVVARNEKGRSRGPDRSFTTLAAGSATPPPESGPLPPPGGGTDEGAQPELGRSVALEPATGSVLVRRRGSSKFVPLTDGAALPMGSEIDAGEGAIELTAELPSGATQTGRFGGGRFLVRQGRRGYIDLYLRGRVCPRPTGVASAAARRSRGGRKLWGRDRGGRFRTHGKNSHATVRGTRWLVQDRCKGTLTRVTEGSVVVRDKVRGKRVVVEAGERYLARPRR